MDHHHHGHCGHESDAHEHDAGRGQNDNLFTQIDRSNVVALNADGEGSLIIKPWDERLYEDKSIESDADDQLIIRVPFTASVKLYSVLLKTGPTDQTPSKVLLFANEDNVDFDDVTDKKPSQEFNIAQGREVGEYNVMPAKFSNLSSITLFFPSSQGADSTKIYYLGFLGTWTERHSSPVIAVYETRANLADHPKIQGTGFSASQT